MSSKEAYRPDPEEIDMEKLRTPSPPGPSSLPKAKQPKDPRAKAKYNIFSRIFFL